MRVFFTVLILFFTTTAYAQSPTFDTGASDAGDLTTTGIDNTQVVYDSSGTLVGESGFEYDDVTNTLDVGHIETDVSTKTDSFTWALTDNGYLRFDSSGSMTGTVPPNSSVAFPTGSIRCFEIFDGANTGTIVAGSGVTVNTNTSLVYTSAAGCLVKVDTDQWTAVGGD